MYVCVRGISGPSATASCGAGVTRWRCSRGVGESAASLRYFAKRLTRLADAVRNPAPWRVCVCNGGAEGAGMRSRPPKWGASPTPSRPTVDQNTGSFFMDALEL
ncbi:hypothetical protein GWI33_002775 [Rhynchophorus ferrugineus]|uniref:Uncharacterized protein n=1 Tax=Rhynchophorus ferrugineus TaxID=354439 RepID=A0A834IYC7_RHYFE|nr:hypothetical protein GWI33_002775 [Rhynchophorus ferrugineus]